MDGIVAFENVGLRYGTGSETLSDLSFALRRGSFHFLTGASGAGKTSLLGLVTLSRRPSRGLIRLFGEDVVTLPRAALPGFRRRIGVVYQDFRLVPHLSAFDNVALPLRIAGTDERDIQGTVGEMLDWVGLGARADARPATLSGGEQQRVAIARAVIARPELIVADEPTGNVDPEMAGRLFHLLESLNRLGTTVLVATHDAHRIGRDAVIGGAAGFAAAAIGLLLIDRQFAALGAGLIAGGRSGWPGWLLLVAIPVVLAALTTLAGRIAVTATLARLP